MKTTRLFALLAGLAIVLAEVGIARGQETTAAGPSAGESSSMAETPAPPKETPRYLMLLNSDQMITMNEQARHRLLYGVSLTQGYDDGILTLTQPNGTNYTLFNPLAGFIGHKPKSEYAFQYSPIVGYFAQSAIGTHAFHQADFHARGEINRRWGWNFQAAGRYGVLVTTLLSPFRFSPVGNIAAVDPNSVILDTFGNRLDSDAGIGLSWHKSARTVLGFAGTYSYSNFFGTSKPGTKNHFNRSAFNGHVDHVVSRKVTVRGGINTSHIFGGRLPCTYYGAEAGMSVHPNERVDLTFGGGPQFGDRSCTSNRFFALHGSAGIHLTRAWSAYLTADRSVMAPFHSTSAPNLVVLGSDQITDSYAAGLVRRLVSSHLEMRLDGGYLRTISGIGRIGPPASAHGSFVSPQVGWHFTRTLMLLGVYKRLYQVNSVLSQGRNQVFGTLVWRPEPRELGDR